MRLGWMEGDCTSSNGEVVHADCTFSHFSFFSMDVDASRSDLSKFLRWKCALDRLL